MNNLEIIIQKEIEKEKRQLRKIIKESKQQITLEKKVNMQKIQKYVENKISYMRKYLFQVEN